MRPHSLLLTVVLPAAALTGHAQTSAPLGSVSAQEATVDRGPGQLLPANGDRFQLTGSTTVRAREGRNAAVALARGGTILVCRTSPLHLAGSPDTLLIGLDRGALEIRTKSSGSDAIATPDLRIVPAAAGALDLRLRVSPNGDTCVENRGRKAPTLLLRDNFGEASYQVLPNQHVLFEHGSLKAVVDRETTPCGCPPEDAKPVPLADAILHGTGARVTPEQAAAANPFPTAQSEGLAQPTPLPADKPGETHTQVSTTLAFDPTAPRTPAPASAAQPEPPLPPSAPATSGPAKGGPFRAVGRFFKRIFVR